MSKPKKSSGPIPLPDGLGRALLGAALSGWPRLRRHASLAAAVAHTRAHPQLTQVWSVEATPHCPQGHRFAFIVTAGKRDAHPEVAPEQLGDLSLSIFDGCDGSELVAVLNAEDAKQLVNVLGETIAAVERQRV